MKRQIVIHPFLFALFPVVFLYAPNRAFFGPEITLRPAAVSIAVAALVWLALRLVTGDAKRAALGVSLAWFLLFAFGSLRDTVTQLGGGAGLGEIGTAHQIVLGSALAVLTALVAFFKLRKYLDQVTYLLNVIGTVLVCMSLTDVVISRLLEPSWHVQLPASAASETAFGPRARQSGQPDIYYLVLDGYGRSDQLERLYGFNNDEFVNFLEDQGFYVAHRSSANYPQTLLSLASSLNFEYLDEAFGADLAPVEDRRFARDLVRHSRAVRLLRDAGYTITAIATPYHEAEIARTDVLVTDWRYPTIFELGLLDMTPLPWALSRLGVELFYDLHRSRIMFSLEKLAEMPREPGPKFVYAHMLYAHPPFVFDEKGGPVNPDRPYGWVDGEDYFRQTNSTYSQYIDGYRSQVRFLNERLRETIAAILANSEQPPVIILHGDHGPGANTSLTSLERTDVEERYGIFNAYYLPGGHTDLYESVSPVNSFRIVFNRYLGTSLPLLEDKRYYAPLDHPYAITSVEPIPAMETVRSMSGQPSQRATGSALPSGDELGEIQ